MGFERVRCEGQFKAITVAVAITHQTQTTINLSVGNGLERKRYPAKLDMLGSAQLGIEPNSYQWVGNEVEGKVVKQMEA